MFFKNISEWSKKRIRIANIICNIVYTILILVIPIIIVCTRYKIFKSTTAGYKLTGFGIIFFVILGLYAYRKIKAVVTKLPQITIAQQRSKFTIEMLFNLIPYLIVIVAFWFTKDSVQLAYKTMLDCVLSLVFATLFDGLIFKYIQAEYDLRAKALELNEIDKRRSKL